MLARVMARPLRIEFAGATYRVMAPGNQGRAIFLDDRDRRRFLETVEEACGKTGWRIHAYLVMGNHYHLLVEMPEANLVSGMKWLQGTYTHGVIALAGRASANGPLHQRQRRGAKNGVGRAASVPKSQCQTGAFGRAGGDTQCTNTNFLGLTFLRWAASIRASRDRAGTYGRAGGDKMNGYQFPRTDPFNYEFRPDCRTQMMPSQSEEC